MALNEMRSKVEEIVALTASRSGEIRGAHWDEINLAKGIWTIPDSTMKAGRKGFDDSPSGRSGRSAVSHGLRSCFRDWVAGRTA